MARDNREDFILSELKDLSKKTGCIEVAVAQQQTSFESHMKQSEEKYNELQKSSERQNEILHNNTESLKEYMQQTVLLKETMIKMDARLCPIEIERIKKQAISEWRKNALIVGAKVFTLLAGSGGLVMIVREILSHVKW
jgi:galactokinase/mevalonate kinase-like predicted kinase